MLAPAAKARALVVPAVAVGAGEERCRHQAGAVAAEADGGGAVDVVTVEKRQQKNVPHAPRRSRLPRPRYSWAELMRRVFLVDGLTCPECRGRRRVLAGIFAADAIRRILEHLVHSAQHIGGRLQRWAHGVRLLGNEAAHDLEREATADDVRDIIDLVEAILLYVFALDVQFRSFEAHMRQR